MTRVPPPGRRAENTGLPASSAASSAGQEKPARKHSSGAPPRLFSASSKFSSARVRTKAASRSS